MPFAHSRADLPRDRWHSLRDHLTNVGRHAGTFASGWSGDALAHLAGLWHDLGKYAPDWQDFLVQAGEEASVLSDDESPAPPQRRRGPDHSTAGALHAAAALPKSAALIQFAIAGHHAGLSSPEDLKARLTAPGKRARYELARNAADPDILTPVAAPRLPRFLTEATGDAQQRTFELLTRMTFSALVDADFLDTEEFMDAEGARAPHRRGWPALEAYRAPLDQHLERLRRNARGSEAVLAARADVLRWCRDAAPLPRGTFSLTVPTGGGKTLASLAFAIDHALRHGHERIIIVLPFLSIIDQTAAVLRDVFTPHLGDRVLIEHHSSLRPEYDTQRNRLASENWDAPLIVTTQVQFFESLFANRPRDCRKLHNIANSVVILDEVQTLPIGLLDPILDVLQELSAHYGTSLVLTTATQPSLHDRQLGPYPFRGLRPQPREIVPADRLQPLFDALRRVTVTWPQDDRATDWPELAERIAAHDQVLAIVHRRPDARALWREVETRAPGALHLSALMCPAHRRGVLATIRARLDRDEPCRVVSTQLVEAGVDVDFPVVLRAMAGLESLAQSAGRCNRNGRWPAGMFEVFNAPTKPPGPLADHAETARTMLRGARAEGDELDLFAPATFRNYFDRLYARDHRDAHAIQPLRKELDFPETAKRFRMIPDGTTTIFVPWGAAGRNAIDDLHRAGVNRNTLRHLQPFGVSLHKRHLDTLLRRGAVTLVDETVHVLTDARAYDDRFGLDVDEEAMHTWIV